MTNPRPIDAVFTTLKQYTPLVCQSEPPKKKAKHSDDPVPKLSPIEKIVYEALGILESSLKDGQRADYTLWNTLKSLEQASNRRIADKATSVWMTYCPHDQMSHRQDLSEDARKILADALGNKRGIDYYSTGQAQNLLVAAHKGGFPELEDLACDRIMKKTPSTFYAWTGGENWKKECERVKAVRWWAHGLVSKGVDSPASRLCALKTRAIFNFPNRTYHLWSGSGYDAETRTMKAPPTWSNHAIDNIARQLDDESAPLEELVLKVDTENLTAGGIHSYDDVHGGWYSSGHITRCRPGLDSYHMEATAAKRLANSLLDASTLLHFEMDPRVASSDDFIKIAGAIGGNSSLAAFVVQPIHDQEKKGLEFKVLLKALEPNKTLKRLELGYLTDRSSTELKGLRTFWEAHPNLETMVFYARSNPFAAEDTDPEVRKISIRHEVKRTPPVGK